MRKFTHKSFRSIKIQQNRANSLPRSVSRLRRTPKRRRGMKKYFHSPIQARGRICIFLAPLFPFFPQARARLATLSRRLKNSLDPLLVLEVQCFSLSLFLVWPLFFKRLWHLATKNSGHVINIPTLRRVIEPREEIAEQPQSQKLNSSQKNHGCEEQHRPVFNEYVFAPIEFLEQQPTGQGAGRRDHHGPDAAEEVQGAREVTHNQTDGQDVEHHAESARQAVMGFAVHARFILDRDFCDERALDAGHRRDEAVHLAVDRDSFEHFAAIRFERRAEVVDRDSRRARHQLVRDPRRKRAQEAVLAVLTPATDHVVTFFELRQKARDVFRLMLQVAVHGDDHVALGVIESGGQRRCLAEIAPQPYACHARIERGDLPEDHRRAICAAVIDEDQLIVFAETFHHFRQTAIKYGHILFFVMKGDDDGVRTFHFKKLLRKPTTKKRRTRRFSAFSSCSSFLRGWFPYCRGRKESSLSLAHQNCHSPIGFILPAGGSIPTKTGSGVRATPNLAATRS